MNEIETLKPVVSERDAALEQVATLTEQTATLQSDIDAKLAEITMLGEARDALSGELNTLQGRYDAVSAELDTTRESLQGTQADLAATQSKAQDLEGNGSELLARIAELGTERDEIKQSLSARDSTIAEQTASIETLNTDLAQLETDLQSARQKQANLREQLAATVEENSALAAELGQGSKRSAALAQQLSDALADVEPASLRTDDDGSVVIQLSNGALFNSGRAQLSDSGRRLMSRVGETLLELDNAISVEGHTDNIPINDALRDFYPSNWELSLARANSATRYLQQRVQIPASRLRSTGFAEFSPLVPNDSRENRARNRRVEIRVLPAN